MKPLTIACLIAGMTAVGLGAVKWHDAQQRPVESTSFVYVTNWFSPYYSYPHGFLDTRTNRGVVTWWRPISEWTNVTGGLWRNLNTVRNTRTADYYAMDPGLGVIQPVNLTNLIHELAAAGRICSVLGHEWKYFSNARFCRLCGGLEAGQITTNWTAVGK